MLNNFYHRIIQNKILKHSLKNKKESIDESAEKLNRKAVLFYLNIEKNKIKFNDTINDEYNEKVILYGYVIVKQSLIFLNFNLFLLNKNL